MWPVICQCTDQYINNTHIDIISFAYNPHCGIGINDTSNHAVSRHPKHPINALSTSQNTQCLGHNQEHPSNALSPTQNTLSLA